MTAVRDVIGPEQIRILLIELSMIAVGSQDSFGSDRATLSARSLLARGSRFFTEIRYVRDIVGHH